MSSLGDQSSQNSRPGTLTQLIEEVLRGTPGAPADAGWGASLRAGEVIGRYELLREAGRGGFGVVWEARDRDLGRTVALKALRAGAAGARDRRLLAEAEVAARLSHPSIVTILDVGRCERGVYLVQEFVEGVTLAERLADGALPPREALRIASALAHGLAHAHAHGVVHRDLSATNVMCGDDGLVKILDLGMASALGRRKLQGGTAECMAPEQLAGAPEDERTDVFALGVLTFRMLTGEVPFPGEVTRRSRRPARGVDVPGAPGLGPLVEAMLSETPLERPRDGRAVLEALEAIDAAWPAERGSLAPPRIRRPAGRRRLVEGMVVGSLLPLVIWALSPGLTLRGGQPEPLAVAAVANHTECHWREARRIDFDLRPPGTRSRNGRFGDQGPVVEGGVPSWAMNSDWNQLWIPLDGWKPDVFAVTVEFRIDPVPSRTHLASLSIFTDPVGEMGSSSSDQADGVGLLLRNHGSGPSTFIWGRMGLHGRPDYQGGFSGSITGEWHSLRIEGSRTRRWLRALLDGELLLMETGRIDLTGGFICLGGSTEAYQATKISWRVLQLLEGTEACR